MSDLLKGLEGISGSGDMGIEIHGITYDSRKVQPGYLFAAISGGKDDGHRYIPEAIRRGASALLVGEPVPNKLSQLIATTPRAALADLAAAFYAHPSSRLRVIGITGTNGKTTLTYLLEAILTAAGRKVGVLGTVNYRFAGRVIPAPMTTPESTDIQALFAEMEQSGVSDVVMEVSSHAIDQGRIRGIHFDAVALTNISQDHFDYHATWERYAACKLRLLTEFLPVSKKAKKVALVNTENAGNRGLLDRCPAETRCVGLEPKNHFSPQSFHLNESGIEFSAVISGEPAVVKSPLLGQFNLENILLATAVADALQIPAQAVVRGISQVQVIPGRLEQIPNKRGLQIFVDYAHTPEALARVGQELRRWTRGRLITVFGCGGDRDREKRPLMGTEVAKFSDLMIVTSDNPRTEDPLKIIADIRQGLKDVSEECCFTVLDRAEALQKALALAEAGDTLLVAGKGHEDYQIIGDKKIHFSDQEMIRELLASSRP